MIQPAEDNVLHDPVLYHEIILALRPKSPGRYVDATLGAGGHAGGILEASSPDGCLLGMDLDPQALAIARQRLARYGGRFTAQQRSYVHLRETLAELGWDGVDGIVVDLGVSSMQIDTPQRGFSFQSDGPLDMRFGPEQPRSAAQIVNQWAEADLADILWRYGEERSARRIARLMVQQRPFETTRQLAEAIARGIGGPRGKIHPATRTFQALRIAVNDELRAVEELLPQAVEALNPGGRLAVISFHSLEDRIVKQYFHRESRDCVCPPERLICTCGHRAIVNEISRRPLTAGETEIQRNSRARSAKLRVVEKR